MVRGPLIACVLIAAACGKSSTPAPSQGSAVAAPRSAIDAARAIATDGGTVAAAPIRDAGAPLDSALDSLPSTAFAAPFDPGVHGAAAARYALATSLVAAEPPKALALLAELARAPRCDDCGGLVLGARWDDAWRPLWDSPTFRAAVTAEPPPEPAVDAQPDQPDDNSYGAEPSLHCPPGTRRRGTWDVLRHDRGEIWCAKPNGVRHGPYRYLELGCSMGEGSCSADGDYVDGKKQGWWSDGGHYEPYHDGAYVADQPHGLWSITTKDRTQWLVYVHGVMEGESVTFFSDDGAPLEDEHYAAGALDGAYRAWQLDPPHRKATEGAYAHGKKDGVWMIYDEDGHPRVRQTWDHEIANGLFKYWDEHGTVLGTATIAHGTGAWVEYDELGTELGGGPLVDGVKEGAWAGRNSRDEPWETGAYTHGARTGTWTRYDDKGGPRTAEGAYVAGARDGAWTYWRSDGSLLAKGSFAKGKLDGHWTISDEHGAPAQELDFRRGVLARVDGDPATAALRRGVGSGFADTPAVIEPRDPEPPMPAGAP